MVQTGITNPKKLGPEVARFAGHNTPVVSSLWYLRAAWQRVMVDQLQYLTDPNAHRAFRNREQTLRRETGQGFFWRPGEMAPDR